jgi:predicted NAD/FAD-dependent oxidoreductase
MTSQSETAIVGAGISGLTLARALAARGRMPVVLERSRGVGGRCATRRIQGQPVDHGVAYLHGRSERFRSELDAFAGEPRVEAWPRSLEGIGLPCQPESFEVGAVRIAPSAGVNRFAKHLAPGLDIRLQTEVVALHPVPRAGPIARWDLTLASGEILRAGTVVLTMPPPSAIRLLRTLAPLPDAVAGLLPLLELIQTLACLTVIARYAESVSPPTWEASLPSSSPAIHTILHDSSKRAGHPRLILVVQARPHFSREMLDEPAERWTRALLVEAAAVHGAWAAEPEFVQSHIWRHARVDSPSRLAAPILVRLEGGATVALAGDGFHPAGGVEGAYLSGLGLADRLLEIAPRTGFN